MAETSLKHDNHNHNISSKTAKRLGRRRHWSTANASPSSKPLLSSPPGASGARMMMTSMITPSPVKSRGSSRRIHPNTAVLDGNVNKNATTAATAASSGSDPQHDANTTNTHEESTSEAAPVTSSTSSSSTASSTAATPITSHLQLPKMDNASGSSRKGKESGISPEVSNKTRLDSTAETGQDSTTRSSEQTTTTTAMMVSPASTHTGSSTGANATAALEYSARACECLEQEDLARALVCYQCALELYQQAQPLGIVDTCNAAATLHNMGAVYNVLNEDTSSSSEQALTCYYDAEQLYRDCAERLQQQQKDLSTVEMTREELAAHDETVCLSLLVAETLQNRATIYESSSVWDSVASLECHEACVEWLLECEGTKQGTKKRQKVTCVDDVYFQLECPEETKVEMLTNSYQALSQLYRNSDSPQDGLQALLSWKTLVQSQLRAVPDSSKWRKSLVECWKMLSEYHFAQQEMTLAMESLYSALDLQLQSNAEPEAETSKEAAESVLSPQVIEQMNSMGLAQEEQGEYDQALVSYEKILLLTSRYLGDDHWEVAETLVKIGRVMEHQGNLAGGLDLYHAAHTIYQAAIKKATPERDEQYEQALNTRAATESVVRIANVLMSQKRWQEAVQFLKELPQAKEWLTWLGSDDESCASAMGEASSHSKRDSQHPPKPSVDQAIVFRELGRAYMGMGSLSNAKQCLLESARRLEGTDHEEDVFELLMHVEFCQKQEQRTTRGAGRRRSRSRSVSRARSRSRHSHNRNSSTGSSSMEETVRAVAAVLSPTQASVSSSQGLRGSRSNTVTPTQLNSTRRQQSPSPSSAVVSTSKSQSPPPPDHQDQRLPSGGSKSTSSPEQNSSSRFELTAEKCASDSKSLGSLGTESDDGSVRDLDDIDAKDGTDTPVQASAEDQALERDEDVGVDQREGVMPRQHKESYKIQRAKYIVAENSSRRESSDPQGIYEENDQESDIASSLMGIHIDIDSPPSSPHLPGRIGVSASEPAHSELVSAVSSTSDRPFDEEATASHCSSNDRPSVDKPSLKHRLSIGCPSPQIQNQIYPMMVQERMMPTHSDSDSRSDAHPLYGESLSDLTPSLGRSSSSLSEVLAQTKAARIPPLLQPAEDAPRGSARRADNEKSLLGPLGGVGSTHDLIDGTVESHEDPEETIEGSSESDEDERTEGASVCDDDDASSDPFEGYEDFDIEDVVSEGEVTSDYGGDSESEQDYTRFAKEDFSASSADGGSDSSHQSRDLGRSKEDFSPATMLEDTRQPYSNQKQVTKGVSAGSRDSPRTSPVAREVHMGGSKSPRTISNGSVGATSPTFSISEKRSKERTLSPVQQRPNTPSKESTRAPTPNSKKSAIETSDGPQEDEVPKHSPGNRIVRAFSNSIRRRRKPGFDALTPSEDDKAEEVDRGIPVSSPEDPKPSAELEFHDDFEEEDVVGPIPFISMTSPSQEDDAVSQITFTQEDFTTNNANKNNSQWWRQLGGLTTGKLDNWFPNEYLNQAVEAAEGFLSANVIHSQMKSQPLDFEAEENDIEDDNVVVGKDDAPDTSVTQPLAIQGAKELVLACSPIPNELLFSTNAAALEAPVSPGGRSTHSLKSKQSEGSGKNKMQAFDAAAPITKPDLSAEQLLALGPPSSRSKDQIKLDDVPGKSDLVNEIERYERLLKQYESEGSSKASKDSHKVAGTMFRLAVLYIQHGDVQKAMKATKEALRIQKTLGDPADACRSLHLLADIYVRKGQYESALSCYSEVQNLELQLYGYIHEETANTLNRIGSVLARKGDFGGAIEKHQEALRILKEYHGEELRHPLVSQTLIHIGAVYYRERNSLATVRNNVDGYSTFIEAGMLEVIGRAHEDRGSYKMAISFFEEKLQFLNQKWNDLRAATSMADLDDIATTLNSLGMLSCRAGFYMEAIEYYERALEVQKKVGCDKMHIATAKVLTATVQFQLGYFQKALRLLQEALQELKLVTGKNHETVAATWFQIGVVRVALCEYDDAMDALEEALRIQTKLLGKFHPATLRTRREIGNMYAIYESELDAAFIQFHDILETQKKIHGAKHPNVAETLHSLGCAYARRGDYAKAIKVLEECYNMRVDFLGADHPLQAATLYEIAHIHMKRERYKKAVCICDTVLEIRRESLSEDHIDVARTLATRGSCLVVTGDYNQALKCFEEAFPMAEKAVGSTHPAVADIHILFAAMHLRKCHFDEAKVAINKALAIYQRSSLDEDHPSLKEAVALMDRVERDEMLCV